MFKFGSKKQAVTPEETKAIPTRRLVMQLGSMGWSATMVDRDGSAIGQPLHKDVGNLELQGQERIEKITAQAMEEIGHTMLKDADAVSVLIEGPTMVFSDSKQEGLRAASDATARIFGQRMINAPATQAVTFGYAPFGPDPEADRTPNPESSDAAAKSATSRRPSVYAFADVRQIRAILSLFDIAALKVTSLIPAIYPIIAKAVSQPEDTYGAILLGSHETTIVLTHYNLHGVLVRTSPVGVVSLAQAVSEKAGITLNDAMDNLSKRNLVAKILPADQGGDKSLTTNPYQAGLEPGLHQLLADIQDTLEYFMAQRVCGKPLQLECFGDISRINGLDRWLTKYLQLDLVPASKPPLHLYIEAGISEECNLLRGAETSLISVGKVKYSFSKSGFVKTSALATQSQSMEVKAGSGRMRKSGGRPSGRRRQEHLTKPGLMQSLVAKLRGLTSKEEQAKEFTSDEAETASDQTRTGALVMLTLGGLLLYWGYDQYAYQVKLHKGQVSAYLMARENNTNNLKAAVSAKIGLPGSKGEDINKVFWTDKFIALSQAMNQHIWLTDLYLTSAQMELAGAKVETKKLVMEGAVLPSWDGHIGRMSEFLAALSDQEKNTFMNDFRQITFRGSNLDSHDDIVHFGFEAWYDRNKRIEENKRKVDANDMSGNLDAIKESTKAKEDALKIKIK